MLKIECEGSDGAGKTTGLKYFVDLARSRGLNVVETREVGNPHIPFCVKMRELVLNPDNNIGGDTMELIFSAMRLENDKWLRKLVESDSPPDFVVSDRGWTSHLAYSDHNVNEEFVQRFYLGVMEKLTLLPDVIIYFSVNSETALKRRVKRGGAVDVIEAKGVEFQDKVRDSFEKYFQDLAPKVAIFEVDANDTIEGVQEQLDTILDELISVGTAGYFQAMEESQI